MTNNILRKTKRPTLTSMTAFALKLTEQAPEERSEPTHLLEVPVKIPSGRIIQAIDTSPKEEKVTRDR